MSPKADSTKEMIYTLTEKLDVNPSYLAGMLGVSEKSLSDWKNLGLGDLTPKAKRLSRLYEVIYFISNKFPHIPNKDYKKLLLNGRITIDPTDEEDGSTSLITFITAEPENNVWVAAVAEAIESMGPQFSRERSKSNASKSLSQA